MRLALSAPFSKLAKPPKKVSTPGAMRVQIRMGSRRAWLDDAVCTPMKPQFRGDRITSYCRAVDSAGNPVSFPDYAIRRFRIEPPEWPVSKLVGAGAAGLLVGYVIHKLNCPTA